MEAVHQDKYMKFISYLYTKLRNMRKAFMTFIAVTATLMVLSSCGSTDKVRTRLYERYVEEELAPGSGDTLSMIISLQFPVEGATEEVLGKMSNTILGYSKISRELDIDAAVDKYIETRLRSYRETNLPLLEESAKAGEKLYNLDWDDFVEGYFVGRWGDVISYRLDTYSFSGGAHGTSGAYCINIDLNTGEIVRDRDVFVEGDEEKMSILISQYLREQFPNKEDYNALYNKNVSPSANYLFKESGIVYVYEEYELGPYYFGCVSVHVPWSKAKALLKVNE